MTCSPPARIWAARTRSPKPCAARSRSLPSRTPSPTPSSAGSSRWTTCSDPELRRVAEPAGAERVQVAVGDQVQDPSGLVEAVGDLLDDAQPGCRHRSAGAGQPVPALAQPLEQRDPAGPRPGVAQRGDRKSTRLN